MKNIKKIVLTLLTVINISLYGAIDIDINEQIKEILPPSLEEQVNNPLTKDEIDDYLNEFDLNYLDFDNGDLRLIVNVATGRKYWPIFSTIIKPELSLQDPGLKEIKANLKKFTHPMIDRFVNEINTMLSDVYQIDIDIRKIDVVFNASSSFSTTKI